MINQHHTSELTNAVGKTNVGAIAAGRIAAGPSVRQLHDLVVLVEIEGDQGLIDHLDAEEADRVLLRLLVYDLVGFGRSGRRP